MDAQMDAEGERDTAQEMVDANAAPEVAARAAQLAPWLEQFASMDGYDSDDDRAPGADATSGVNFRDDATYLDNDDFDGPGAGNDGDETEGARFEDDLYPGQIFVPFDAPNGRGGLTITNTAGEGVMISKVNDAPVEFQEYEVSESMAPAIEGWDSLVLERRNDADNASQILYAYTDIATAGSETFLEKYGSSLTGGTLTVSAANFAAAAAAGFPTHTQDDVEFAMTTPAFAGTFDGVPGEFTCNVGECHVRADDGTGELSIDDNDDTTDVPGAVSFIFTPDDLATAIVKGDGTYLYFDYWLHKPDAPGETHPLGVLYGGNDMFTVRGLDTTTVAVDDMRSHVHALAGEARYSGPAAGKYVTRNVAANTAKIGQFTATAELHVDFDADSSVQGFADPATEPALVPRAGEVDGVIKDFMGRRRVAG